MIEGYKMTPIGAIPNDWDISNLGEFLDYIQPINYITNDISKIGVTPVLTANKAFILGYTNEKENIFFNVPVIIFDDFTTDSKLVDFPFKVRSSALKILKPKGNSINIAFLYESLKRINYQCTEHKRYWISEYQFLKIPVPPLPEQQKIAEILSTIDDKIEVIDQQIIETQALKKGLMQRLLTKGIGHTEFKDSPLGMIPKSWEIDELRNVAKCTVGIATSTTHAYCEDGVLLLRNQNIKEGKIALKDVLYITPEFDLQNKSKRLKEGDIITVRTGYPGISAVVPKELSGSQSFTTLIIRLHNKNILSPFLCYYINSEKGKSFFQSNQAGGGQQNVGSKTLESLKIIVPTIVEQKQITETLITIDEKLEILFEKKTYYQELKQGLMQQLLTGKIRVKV